MIIYDMRKLVKITNGEGVGVVGENLALREEFFIKGLTDSSMRFSLFLRFADGSVNAVFPDSAEVKNGGVSIIWNVRKNDLFMHGYFELQIEGRIDDELIFQTEIIRLYADESIPIEDDKYPNPNSESLKLRDEIYRLLDEIESQQKKIDENLKKIEDMKLPEKEDVANKVSNKSEITNEAVNYPSINYLTHYYYDQDKVNDLLNNKEDTLSVSVTFDKNGIPLSIVNRSILSAGNFSAGYEEAVTAFIPSSVTAIQGGSLSGCAKLTDVYIDNTSGRVAISNGAIPSTAKIHYKDEYSSLSQIETALHSIKKVLLPQKADVLSVSATFDKNGIPLSIVNRTTLSAGNFSSSYKDAVTAFIPSSVTAIQGGSLSGCTNLTDVYIDNTPDNVTISDSAIPPTAKIHYKDDYNTLSQIETALHSVKKILLPQKADILSLSATFDKNGLPLSIVDKTILSAGDFSSGYKEAVTAFIPSSVTSVQGGSLSGCTNLTDVYIDNTSDNVTISDSAIPSTAKIHYKDEYNSFSQIETALHSIKKILLPQKADTLSLSATFDKNGIPLSIVDKTILSAGDFSSGYKQVVTAFIPSSVTSVQGGSLSGCTNLTDVYINNTPDRVTISDSAIPSTAKIHYNDECNPLSQIETALHSIKTQKADVLPVSVTFDKNGIPLSIVDKTILSAGDFSSGYKETVTAFIPSSVTSVQGGSLSGCTNLTDVYIDNTPDHVTVSDSAIPSSAKIHYKDDYNSLSQIETALKSLNTRQGGSIDASAITGKISISNLPAEALTKILVVTEESVRLKLTSSTIQDGDFIKVESTGKVYIVKDSGRLGTEDAFVEITSSVDSIDATAIKGKIPVENLPMEALTRLITVGDDAARLALNKSLIQDGDFVKVESTGKIYIVKDSGRLGREDAFVEISGGSSSNNPGVDVSTVYDEEEELLNITTTNSGTIPVNNLPPEALTRLVKVDNETARLLLNDETVQNGDLVKVESTNKTYIVYDSSRLGTEEAFEEVTGTAISASYDAADQSILL